MYQDSKLMHIASSGKRVIFKSINGAVIVLDPKPELLVESEGFFV